MTRVPHAVGDDCEMACPEPCWDFMTHRGRGNGLLAFAFHPALVYLNADNTNVYQRVKEASPDISAAEEALFRRYVNPKVGCGTLFDELVAHLSLRSSLTIAELVDDWRAYNS